MTWNNDGDRIVVICHPDSPGGTGTTNGLRDIAVGTGFAVGNPEQFVPDGFLERCTLDIHRKLKVSPSALEVLGELFHGFLISGRIGNGALWDGVPELDGSDAFLGGSDRHRAHWAVHYRVMHGREYPKELARHKDDRRHLIRTHIKLIPYLPKQTIVVPVTANPDVTIVVVPRERFSYARRSLSSVFENTATPFKLIYVDPGTPSIVRKHLQEESERRKFKLLSRDGYISPNRARNWAWQEVQTKYTVFLDNDALVAPGWLEELVRCADETGAVGVVGPLYLIGEIQQRRIHLAGGRLHEKQEHGKKILYDEQYLFDTPLDNLQAPLEESVGLRRVPLHVGTDGCAGPDWSS